MTDAALITQPWISATGLHSDGALIENQPFPFLVAKNMLPDTLREQVHNDFPVMKGAGYLPYDAEACGNTINRLLDMIQDPEFADPLGEALGIERLSQYPTYISISKKLNKRHGTIHTDGKSKVATMLLYLNQEWAENGLGCLRFLNRIDDIEDMVVPEIPPRFGTLVAFKRTENSFHGHLPFEGERRVLQIAWLVSTEDKLRKAKRGKLSNGIKKLFGWLDTKVGRGRKDNAYNQ